jgi:hypothetical protein
MGKKLKVESDGRAFFNCPGCHDVHGITVAPHANPWKFDGNLEKPTIYPSVKTWWQDPEGNTLVCHSFITAGQIKFLNDCHHDLKDKVVDLPDWDF